MPMPMDRYHLLFHCTPTENWETIKKEGLCPQFGWNTSGIYVTRHSGIPTAAVYPKRWDIIPVSLSIGIPMTGFVGSITMAKSITVLEVNAWGLTLGPDCDGPGYLGCYEWIPPDLIEFVETVPEPKEGW